MVPTESSRKIHGFQIIFIRSHGKIESNIRMVLWVLNRRALWRHRIRDEPGLEVDGWGGVLILESPRRQQWEESHEEVEDSNHTSLDSETIAKSL